MSEQEQAKEGRALFGRVDPGARAVVIAGVILVLVLTSVLPWVGDAAGWQVLTGQADPALHVGLLPRLFSINSTIVGVAIGALALATRRWAIAWVAALAGVVVSFEGVIAIWSRQTVPNAGPGIGLLLAVLCMVVLAVQWLKVVWSRD
ncbi:membrane protein [Saccharopolyspora taberi]|uniref:Membrane protein n=1 Tax=Saccharopolyspora taberi TaxID=60895 RepID=A0ABN3VFR5_9PSEU